MRRGVLKTDRAFKAATGLGSFKSSYNRKRMRSQGSPLKKLKLTRSVGRCGSRVCSAFLGAEFQVVIHHHHHYGIPTTKSISLDPNPSVAHPTPKARRWAGTETNTQFYLQVLLAEYEL